MSDPSASVSIRLEVNVPVGVTAAVQQSPAPKQLVQQRLTYRPAVLDGDVASVDPTDGCTKTVRPRTGSALGCICARVTLNVTAADVYAKVYPEPLADPHSAPPHGSVRGRNTSGNTWVWDDSVATGDGCAVPLVDHLASGALPKNTFTIWYGNASTGTWSAPVQTQFFGSTGTSGYCGSGSAAGGGAILATAAMTFPAVWCVEMTGFAGAEAAFNNSFTLRSRRAAAAPVWENQADGEAAPRLELHHSPHAHEWTLHARLGGHRFTTQASSPSGFGPLFFPAGAASGGVAAAGGPRIIAFPL